MERFSVVGVGPGGRDYLLPAARRAIEEAAVLMGAERHLSPWRGTGKELVPITGRISETLDELEERRRKTVVALLVTGDPGFYSLLGPVSRRFRPQEYRVIPGLSSFQLACARAGVIWQEATVTSVHGRPLEDLIPALKESRTLIVLTDRKHNPASIAALALEAGVAGHRRVWIGSELSYPEETVVQTTLAELERGKDWGLCVMILM